MAGKSKAKVFDGGTGHPITIETIYDRDMAQTYFEVSCPTKRKHPFHIVPDTLGYGHWAVQSASGEIPKQFQGTHLRINSLQERVMNYLRGMKPTQVVKKKSKEDN